MPKNSILGVWWVSVVTRALCARRYSYTVHQSDTTTVSDCALLALSYLAPTRCGPKSSRPAPAPGAAEAAAAATNCAAGCAEVPLPNAGLARQTTAGELALPPTTAV